MIRGLALWWRPSPLDSPVPAAPPHPGAVIPSRSCVKLAYEHAQRMIEGTFTGRDPAEEPMPCLLQPGHTWEQVPPTPLAVSLPPFSSCITLARIFQPPSLFLFPRLSHREASPWREPLTPPHPRQVVDDVLTMNSVARKLRAARHKEGALRLDNVKLNFRLDTDGNPVSATPHVQREANQMIEEFMLLANRRVAEFISRAFPDR